MSAGRKKRKGVSCSSDVESLSLVAEPAAEVTESRSPPQCAGLEVRKGNRVWGLVEDRLCSIQLDSGTSHTFLFPSLARELGLDLAREAPRTETDTCHLWTGSQRVQFIILEDVHITLEGGVNVWTPVRVFPEALERYYDPRDLVLDVNLLQRGRMVQTFGRGESRLYIREPHVHRLSSKAGVTNGHDQEHSLSNAQERERKNQLQGFWVRIVDAGEASKEHYMSVVLDTGAEKFYVSRNALRMMTGRAESAMEASLDLEAGQGEVVLPYRVSLDLRGGHCLEIEHVELVPQEAVDLVMGVHLLHKYGAVVDYGDHSLLFTVDGQHFKIKLQPQ